MMHDRDRNGPRVPVRLRLSCDCGGEQANRGGDGCNEHADAHHGSDQAAELPG